MLDWAAYILLTVAIGVVTFGLIYLLFAEVLRSARPPEERVSRASDTSFDVVTEEERIGLTPPRYWRKGLLKGSPRSEHKERRGTPTAEDNRLAGRSDER